MLDELKSKKYDLLHAREQKISILVVCVYHLADGNVGFCLDGTDQHEIKKIGVNRSLAVDGRIEQDGNTPWPHKRLDQRP